MVSASLCITDATASCTLLCRNQEHVSQGLVRSDLMLLLYMIFLVKSARCCAAQSLIDVIIDVIIDVSLSLSRSRQQRGTPSTLWHNSTSVTLIDVLAWPHALNS